MSNDQLVKPVAEPERGPDGFLKPLKVRRPKRGPISKAGLALEKVSELNHNLKVILSSLSDKNRRTVVAMASGMDSLQAVIEAGNYAAFTGVAKIVYLKPRHDGDQPQPIATTKLTLKNLSELEVPSYQRLLNLTDAYVKHFMSDMDPKDYILDLREVFKLIAPEMMEVLAKVARDPTAKDADRVRAANSVLDRAGYQPNDPSKQSLIMPVQVNIRFDKDAQAEVKPVIDYGATQSGTS